MGPFFGKSDPALELPPKACMSAAAVFEPQRQQKVAPPQSLSVLRRSSGLNPSHPANVKSRHPFALAQAYFSPLSHSVLVLESLAAFRIVFCIGRFPTAPCFVIPQIWASTCPLYRQPLTKGNGSTTRPTFVAGIWLIRNLWSK